MRHMSKIPAYTLAIAAILSGCGKSPLPQTGSAEILVLTDMVSAYGSPLSKAEINETNAFGNTLYLNETLRKSFSMKALNNPENGIYATGSKWESGEYSFYACMHSGDGISAVASDGRSFTVVQPTDTPSADGSNGSFSDYLLSYTFYVSDGSSRPMVRLQMAHAVSSVELHFVKPAGAADTKVLNAKVSGVKYSASYNVNSHTDSDIRWTVVTGSETTDYSRVTESPSEEFNVPEEGPDGSMYPDGSLYFSFLTCQQAVDNVTDPVTISVAYEINGQSFNASFSLDQVQGVSNWMAGTKTRYAVVLDSEARLYGSIAPWNDGGEMEGSMIP